MSNMLGILLTNLVERLRGGATDMSGQIPTGLAIGPSAPSFHEVPSMHMNAGLIPNPYQYYGLKIEPDQNVPHVTRGSQDALSAIISRVSLRKITGY